MDPQISLQQGPNGDAFVIHGSYIVRSDNYAVLQIHSSRSTDLRLQQSAQVSSVSLHFNRNAACYNHDTTLLMPLRIVNKKQRRVVCFNCRR